MGVNAVLPGLVNTPFTWNQASGYECPCEDVAESDPRVRAMIQQNRPWLWPMLDPREAGKVVLDLIDPLSNVTGLTHVVEREHGRLQQFQCFETDHSVGTMKPLWETCSRPISEPSVWKLV